MTSSPPDVALRELRDDDAEAVARLVSERERSVGYRPATSTAQVREWWSRTTLEENSWALERDGELVAAGWLEVHAGAGEYGIQIRPDAWDEELADRLADLGEARTRELGFSTVRAIALGADSRARALYEARGYRVARRFLVMTIELDERPPEPRVPDGVRIELFRDEHARAFHDVLGEAFAEEWGFTSHPFEEWWARRASDDKTFWFLALSDDDAVGVLRGEPENRGGGFVGGLGVRRAWRGRGIGGALLGRAFRAWYDAGERRVSLGVDSENPTGATRLYERVGMHAELEDVVYEKELE